MASSSQRRHSSKQSKDDQFIASPPAFRHTDDVALNVGGCDILIGLCVIGFGIWLCLWPPALLARSVAPAFGLPALLCGFWLSIAGVAVVEMK